MKALYHLLGKLSLGSKILLVFLFPLVGLAFISIRDLRHDLKVVQQTEKLVELSVKLSAAVHELQKERGASAMLLGSGDAQHAASLTQQRATTDQPVAALRSFRADMDTNSMESQLVEKLDNVMAGLDRLDAIRQSVDDKSLDLPGLLTYYSGQIKEMLNAVHQTAGQIGHVDIAKSALAFELFLEGKERAGQERAVLSNTFARDSFAPGALQKATALASEQGLLFDTFRHSASAESLAQFDALANGPLTQAVASLRQIAMDKAAEGGFGVDAKHWYDTATQRINGLKTIEDHQAESLLAKAHRLEKAALLEAVELVLYFLLACLVAVLVIRSIRASLRRCLVMNQKIAQGDLTARVIVEQSDEIGTLMETMNLMIESLTKVIGSTLSQAQLVQQFSETLATSSHQLRERSDQLRDGTFAVSEAVRRLNGSDQEGQGSSIQRLVSQSINVNGNIGVVERSAQIMSGDIQACTESSRKMAMQTSQLASAVEEMSASLEEIRSNTEHASKMTRHATEYTTTGVSEVGDLDASAKQIESITQLVATIAAQTHLLALNASIEAANAGEAGRGFAVVANEVKVLALKTSEAADKIRSSINTMRHNTEHAVKVIRDIGGLMTDIDEANQMVASAVSQQTGAMREIASGVESLADLADQISKHLEKSSHHAVSVAEQVEQAAGGVASILSGVEEVDRETLAIERIMTTNRQEIDVSTQEIARADQASRDLARIATELNESMTTFHLAKIA